MKNLVCLFAAHAPDVPAWFGRKSRFVNKIVPAPEIGAGYVRNALVEEKESDMARLVRWRVEYAEAMVAAIEARKSAHAAPK